MVLDMQVFTVKFFPLSEFEIFHNKILGGGELSRSFLKVLQNF